jgi:hypothetical protein
VRAVPESLTAYHQAGKPLVCGLDVEPYRCEFWPLDELAELNAAYSVEEFAPGYMGFASSGGGEMFAWAPSGSIVCLAFVGMLAAEAQPVARSWAQFEQLLRPAL